LGNIVQRFSRELKVPYLVTEHWTGYQPEDGRYRGRRVKHLTKSTTGKASAVIVVSEHLREAMVAQQIPGNYHVIPNVVDTEIFQLQAARTETARFIHISSLVEEQKNVSGIIRALAKARKSEPDLSLVIIGSGGDEAKLKKISNELGLTGRAVFFAGRKLEEELANELQKSLALLLNSRFETQGVVIIEALASGIPVIAPAIGGIDRGISEGKGILFEPGNEDALVEAMLQIYRNRQQFEPDQIRKYAVERFSYPVISRQLDEIYRGILSR
jgi:glycosyltransferase involved in cell wall biosynthesis